MKLPLAHIREAAQHRPPSYYEDVVAHGTIEGDSLLLAPEQHQALASKYAVTVPMLIGDQSPPPLPPLNEMTATFWRSMGRWVLAGFPIAWPRDLRARLKQCQANECGQWLGDSKIARCAACGCCAQIKPWLATERCPKGYWDQVAGITLTAGLEAVCRRISGRGKGASNAV